MRRREAGKICCECRVSLAPDPDHEYGERLCPRCTDKRTPKRKVFMYYALVRDHWHCHFREADLKTPLPRKFTFASADKLYEMAKRGLALKDLADKQALEHGIATGRGSLNLNLTAEQYAELKKR